MATLCGRMSRRSDSVDGPPNVEVAHGSAGVDPGTDKMGEIGPVQSISPNIQYNPGKANILADALSRS